MTKIKRSHEVTYSNSWRVDLESDTRFEDETLFNVEFSLFYKNGHSWEQVLRGQVKHNGCADWGYGFPVMLHFCGREDCKIFEFIYDQATKLMQDAEIIR